MPVYAFVCDLCGAKRDELRSVAQRNELVRCLCGAEMTRCVERFRAQTFEPYYDESLGCDVHSWAEKKAVMRELGVIEVGDPVGGARNFDKHAPEHVKPLPVKGVRFRPRRSLEPVVVETVDRDGKTVDRGNFHDLSEW